MAVFAVYIEKQVEYRGVPTRFGNTYHYLTSTGEPFDDALAAQQVRDAERAITSQDISFVGYRTWGPTDGTQFDNVIRDSGEWSGLLGLAPDTQNLYREAGALVVWELPRSPARNRRRWLRKFLRNAIGDTAVPSGVAEGSRALPAANVGEILAQYANPVTDLAALGDFRLCTEDGTTPTSDPQVRPFVVTRQIGR